MRIFIASSNDLAQERKDFRLFLYEQKLEPIVWEKIDHSITKEKFQDRINEHHLNTSDIVVFMIKSKLGKYTKEEFEEACKSLGRTISKIYVYFFKESKDNIEDDQLLEILTLKKYLKSFGDLYQEVDNYQGLEHHFLTQIKHFGSFNKENSIKDIPNKEIQSDLQVKKICLYSSSPLNSSIKFNLGVIVNPFKNFDVEIHHKILNEDSLLDHYDFDLCFIFTKTNNDKVIIEEDDFIQKSITLLELSENIDFCKTTLIIDKEIVNSPFQIKIANSDSQIKKILASTIHKELRLKKGSFKFFKLFTELPELIDIKDFDNNFVGRTTDIENLVKKILILKNENKILTIKGAGGIGKTTLVSKVVNEFALRGKFKDGIKFVQCEFIKDFEDFENKISIAFDMNNAINFKNQLKEQIDREDEDRLIILDNVETILHLKDTRMIKEFIKFISDFSTVIITSREKINEDFEFIYELRELTTDEAEELFIKYYEIKKYDSKFLRREILENMLNNNPLAIKLVTNNLPKNKNLKKLKDELDDDFFEITSKDIENMFEKESDLNIERTKSLFNSINYSYSRLTDKEKLALELLSLFPDGIYFEHFKEFYNKKEKNDKSNEKAIKKKMENFSDKNLKSLEDKSLIVNTNQKINLQSIIGRFADYKFQNKDINGKTEYYKKAYVYNAFLLELIEEPKIKNSVSSHIFDENKNNFLKCLDYIKYLELNENKMFFIDDLNSYFALSSSPNKKIFDKLLILKEIASDSIKNLFFDSQILHTDYFYGKFDFVYNQIQEKYPLVDILNKGVIQNKIETRGIFNLALIYGMEGNQYEEIGIFLKNNVFSSSLFEIGEYNITMRYFNRGIVNKRIDFTKYELMLNTDTLDIKVLKEYIHSLYKTQFIEKIQSYYILLKADRTQVLLKEIRKLIITNPFTEGLKILMIAMKDEKNCSKEMYEEAIKKLYHIKYYHVEAILLYCIYLKEERDDNYSKWLNKGKELALKHHYRFLLHKFKCLENEIFTEYNEKDYPLPERFDYSEFIKENDL